MKRTPRPLFYLLTALLLCATAPATFAQALTPLDLPENAEAEAPIYEDAQGDWHSTLVRVKFGEHVFDVSLGQSTASLAEVRTGYSAVTSLFNQLETTYGTFTIEKMAPSIVWGDTLRVNKRTGATVAISDYSQLFEVWFDAPVPLADVIGDFEALQEVAYAERPMIAVFADEPGDPEYQNDNQYSLPIVDAAQAWDLTRGIGAQGPVGIAVSDNLGCNLDDVGDDDMHPELDDKLEVLECSDVGGGNQQHGYRVAGMAGAETDNDSLVASLGWNVDLFGFNWYTGGIMQILEALEDTSSPAFGKIDIVNFSWTFDGDPDAPLPGYADLTLRSIVRDLLNCGVIVVAAAGNGDGTPPRYPAALHYDGLDAGDGTTYEAQVIAVSATDSSDEFVDLFHSSPGTDPLADPEQAYIDIAAPGWDVTVLVSNLVSKDVYEHDVTLKSGTSYASPMVSALAALVLSINPTLRVDEVYEVITRSTEKVDQNDHPDFPPYTDPVTGESLSWNQFTGYGRINAYEALIYTIERFGATIPAGQTATLGATTLQMWPGAELVVEGTLVTDGTKFTERDAGQGWGGLVVLGAGDLNLTNGTTIEHAATGVTVYDGAAATITGSTLRHNTVGLDVLSDDGTTVSASTVEQNGTGIRTGVPQTEPGAPVPCFTTCRSTLTLRDSFVNDNDDNGVYAISVDAQIEETEMSGNGQSGLRVADATVDPFFQNILDGNGNGAIGFGTSHDGISVLTGGNLQMSTDAQPPFGVNRVVNSLGYELAVASGGTALVGTSSDGGRNSIYDDAYPGALIANNSGGILYARETFWDASSPPSGAFTGSLVKWTPASDCDYTVSPPDCLSSSSRTASGAPKSMGTAEDASGESVARGGGWLRAEILAVRAALAADPASEAAPRLVRTLAALHRFDRGDETGEYAASWGFLRSLRARINGEGGGLPPALRPAAEAVLGAEAVERLMQGDRQQARTLVALAPLAEDAGVRRVLQLTEAHLEAAEGRYAEAAALVAAVAAEEGELDPEGNAEAVLLDLAAVFAERAGEEGSSTRTAGAGARSGAGEATEAQSGALRDGLAVYPNPSTGATTVVLTLAGATDARVVIYDVLGREVATVAEGTLETGTHRLTFNGARLPAGVYLVRATGVERPLTRRITLVR